MKTGDLVKLVPNHQYVNMYEDDELDSIENGERLYSEEISLVLKTKGHGKYIHLKVLTPRGTIGWIQR